jgi:hypothetical protein
MAIITDPDSLDRFQVLVDYEGERISIRDIDVNTPLAGPNPNGEQAIGGEVLTDNTAGLDFTASGITAGNILVIIEGPNINHWPVTARLIQSQLKLVFLVHSVETILVNMVFSLLAVEQLQMV